MIYDIKMHQFKCNKWIVIDMLYITRNPVSHSHKPSVVHNAWMCVGSISVEADSFSVTASIWHIVSHSPLKQPDPCCCENLSVPTPSRIWSADVSAPCGQCSCSSSRTKPVHKTANMAAKHFYRQGFLLLLFNFISTAALEKRFSDFKRCADEECSSKFPGLSGLLAQRVFRDASSRIPILQLAINCALSLDLLPVDICYL